MLDGRTPTWPSKRCSGLLTRGPSRDRRDYSNCHARRQHVRPTSTPRHCLAAVHQGWTARSFMLPQAQALRVIPQPWPCPVSQRSPGDALKPDTERRSDAIFSAMCTLNTRPEDVRTENPLPSLATDAKHGRSFSPKQQRRLNNPD